MTDGQPQDKKESSIFVLGMTVGFICCALLTLISLSVDREMSKNSVEWTDGIGHNHVINVPPDTVQVHVQAVNLGGGYESGKLVIVGKP